ncbi:MAG TPA: ferredoxin [Pseudonocardiaceae bacterium]|jgi:ferredoxin|nr:ferredoxin [Pseudonocardiaceae bacterium]
MKVLIDQDRCVGSGQCVLAAPTVFDQRDEDGIVVLITDTPSAEAFDGTREAARICPALAIEVDES